MFGCGAEGPDGLPLIEVTLARESAGDLLLCGTACAPEGTILYHVGGGGLPTEWVFTTASAGGPDRGAWRLQVPVPTRPFWVVLSIDDTESGTINPAATIVIRMGRSGSITQRAIDDLV